MVPAVVEAGVHQEPPAPAGSPQRQSWGSKRQRRATAQHPGGWVHKQPKAEGQGAAPAATLEGEEEPSTEGRQPAPVQLQLGRGLAPGCPRGEAQPQPAAASLQRAGESDAVSVPAAAPLLPVAVGGAEQAPPTAGAPLAVGQQGMELHAQAKAGQLSPQPALASEGQQVEGKSEVLMAAVPAAAGAAQQAQRRSQGLAQAVAVEGAQPEQRAASPGPEAPGAGLAWPALQETPQAAPPALAAAPTEAEGGAGEATPSAETLSLLQAAAGGLHQQQQQQQGEQQEQWRLSGEEAVSPEAAGPQGVAVVGMEAPALAAGQRHEQEAAAGAHPPPQPAAWPGLEQLVPPPQAPLLQVAPLHLPQTIRGLRPFPLLDPGQLAVMDASQLPVLDPSQFQLMDPAQLQLLDTYLPVLDVQHLFAAPGLAVPQLLVSPARPGLLPAAAPLVSLPAALAQAGPAWSQMREIVDKGPEASGMKVSVNFNAKDVSTLSRSACLGSSGSQPPEAACMSASAWVLACVLESPCSPCRQMLTLAALPPLPRRPLPCLQWEPAMVLEVLEVLGTVRLFHMRAAREMSLCIDREGVDFLIRSDPAP